MQEVELTNVADVREVTNVFTGYRRYRRLPEGAMSESWNMASEEYPAASVRDRRVTLTDVDNATGAVRDYLPSELEDAVQPGDGVIAWLCDPCTVMYKERHWQCAAAQTARTLLSFGKGFFVPDARLDTSQPQGLYIPDGDAEEAIPTAVASSVLSFAVSLTDGYGAHITPVSQPFQPTSANEGDYWYDSDDNGLYLYDGAKWTAVAAYHTKLEVGTLRPREDYWWRYRGDAAADPPVLGKLYRYAEWEDRTPFASSDTEPADPNEGYYWYDSANSVLKKYVVTGGAGAWERLACTVQSDAPEEPERGDYWVNPDDSVVGLRQYVGAWQEYNGTVYYAEPGPDDNDPANGDLWCDEETHKLYRWGYSGWWHWLDQHVWIYFDDVTPADYDYSADRASLALFRAEDFIRLTGDGEVIDVNVSAVGDDYLLLDTLMTPGDQKFLTASRRMPYLDHAVVHDNRVWGCRYGLNTEGQFVNEVYACRLGDPTNWYSLKGLAEDSFLVSVGEPGQWTGCAVLGDHVVFFKEHCMYKIYGDSPANYTTTLTYLDGIEDGSDRSAVNIGGYLFYKSPRGVMRMADGSMPELYSDQLSFKDRWRGAVGGTDGRKYYLQMRGPDGNALYVYDTYLDIWHMEDPTADLVQYVKYRNGLLAICADARTEDGALWYAANAVYVSPPVMSDELAGKGVTFLYLCLRNGVYLYFPDGTIANDTTAGDPSETPYDERTSVIMRNETDVEWRMATGDFGHDSTEYKRVKSIAVKLWLDRNAWYGAEIMYDEDGEWLTLNKSRHIRGGGSGTDRVEYRLRRCDLYRLRLSGKGKAVIYSITTTYEGDGDRSYGTN